MCTCSAANSCGMHICMLALYAAIRKSMHFALLIAVDLAFLYAATIGRL